MVDKIIWKNWMLTLKSMKFYSMISTISLRQFASQRYKNNFNSRQFQRHDLSQLHSIMSLSERDVIARNTAIALQLIFHDRGNQDGSRK